MQRSPADSGAARAPRVDACFAGLAGIAGRDGHALAEAGSIAEHTGDESELGTAHDELTATPCTRAQGTLPLETVNGMVDRVRV
ncbi:hypothetical protein ACSDR0_42095 [Streptosporangium sp. G11]|uniref:hypothetical protein n=1 Tax=Streptosporangium sp. G11 TaxID=3436926 RepID=UPI003EC1360E